MKSGQKSIYYMAADSLEVARSAPFVEKLIKKGYEVRRGWGRHTGRAGQGSGATSSGGLHVLRFQA